MNATRNNTFGVFEIREVTSSEEWNTFVLHTTSDTFHQSWEWGRIYTELGGRVWYFGLYDGAGLAGVCLTIKIKAKRAWFLHVPHGPLLLPRVVDNEETFKQALDALTKRLVVVAGDEDCVFVRVAPTFPRTERNVEIFACAGYRKAPIFVQSERSWRLTLTKTEPEILGDMRKSTRYILKRAPTYGVGVVCSREPAEFDRFFSLYNETKKNQDFVGQSKKFMKQEFVSFAQSDAARLYFAARGGQDLAAAMVVCQGNAGYYHYGASRKDDENTPAPHLLQWHIIKELKQEGFMYYNFWGIAPGDKPNHPWNGLTVFKKGFGGEELVYLQTQDYVLRWSYWVNWIVETVRRIKRRY